MALTNNLFDHNIGSAYTSVDYINNSYAPLTQHIFDSGDVAHFHLLLFLE